MNPSEAWALLNARAVSPERIARGHTSLTSDDIRAMCAGLPRNEFLMGMAANCRDRRALQDLELRLWVIVSGMAERENWRIEEQRGEMVCRRLAGLALYETIDDTRCQVCNGKGVITFQLQTHPGFVMSTFFERVDSTRGRIRCMGCNGGGMVKLSGRKRADLAGINKDTWTRLWCRRYESIFSMTSGWLQSANRHIAKQIREEEQSAA